MGTCDESCKHAWSMRTECEGVCVLRVRRKASTRAASRGCLPVISAPRRAADAVVAAAAALAHQDPPAGPPHPRGPPPGPPHRQDLPAGPPHPTGAPAPVGARITAPAGARATAPVGAPVGAQATAPIGAQAPAGVKVIAPAGAQVPLGARATAQVPATAPAGARATAPVGAPLQTPMRLGAGNCLCQGGSTAALWKMGRMGGSSSPLRPQNEGCVESSTVLLFVFSHLAARQARKLFHERHCVAVNVLGHMQAHAFPCRPPLRHSSRLSFKTFMSLSVNGPAPFRVCHILGLVFITELCSTHL